MTPEQRALRDVWLAEMWKPCRELGLDERVEKRKGDRSEQRRIEEMSTGLGGQPVEVRWDAS